MSWVAAGVAAASIGGAMIQSNATKKAAGKQGDASAMAAAEQGRQYDTTRADQQPWMASGGVAQKRIADLLGLGVEGQGGDWKDQLKSGYAQTFASNPGFNQDVLVALNGVIDKAQNPNEVFAFTKQTGVPMPGNVSSALQAFENPYKPSAASGSLNKQFTVSDFWNDPVTQLGLDYGRKGIERNLGAMGMRKSGLMLKGLQDYAGTRAAESSSRFYGDQDRVFNRLAGVSGAGQTSTNAVAGAGSTSATNIGNIVSAQGNARGASAIAQGNAWGNAFNNVGSWWNQQNMMKQLQDRSPSYSSRPMNWNTTGDYGYGNTG